jgi:hypothetical protein
VKFDNSVSSEANSSGISQSAVIAGSFVTPALALFLLALGTGRGGNRHSVPSGEENTRLVDEA